MFNHEFAFLILTVQCEEHKEHEICINVGSIESVAPHGLNGSRILMRSGNAHTVIESSSRVIQLLQQYLQESLEES